MFRLDSFKLTDMAACGTELRELGLSADSVEAASESIVRFLYEHLVDANGEPAVRLTRLFKTLRFDELDDDLKRAAIVSVPIMSDIDFLTVMASAGDLPEWNGRRNSQEQALMPVTNIADRSVPGLFSRIIRQLPDNDTFDPADDEMSSYLLEPEKSPYNILLLSDAQDESRFPGHDFVDRFGVRSVLLFGGMVGRSSFYAVLILSGVPISRETAQMFKPISLSIKHALIHESEFRRPLARREPA